MNIGFTYTKVMSSSVWTAFMIDTFVSRKVSNRMSTDRVIIGLKHMIANRNKPKDIIFRSENIALMMRF